MTSEVRDLAGRLLALGYHVTPLEFKSKAAVIRDWQHTLIAADQLDAYFPPNKSLGIGLLTSTEVADGVFVTAFDVDLDDDVLISRVRIATGPGAARKKGKKGVTVIGRSTEAFPRKTYKRKMEDGRRQTAVEVYGGRSQVVLPPSIHPDTGEPYHWLGKPLDEIPPQELPVITRWTIDEVVCAAVSPESPLFALNDMGWAGPGGGGTVDDSVLRATAVMVARGWDDDAIRARVARAVKLCLHDNPNARKWDDRLFSTRLDGMIADARAKGFGDKKPRKPGRNERRIAAVERLIESLGSMERLWRDATVLRQYADGHWPVLDTSELHYSAIHLDLSWMEASDAEAVVRTVFMRVPARKPSSRARICLLNGTLDVMTGEFGEWSAGDMLTSQLPFQYEPEATCPEYDRFILNLFAHDNEGKPRAKEEVEAHVHAFEEFLGLTLIDRLSFEKMLVLLGPPGSGKSVALKIFRLLQDPRAISTVSLNRIHEERYLTSMVGKLVNLSGEIPAEAYVEEETFKKLLSGDGVTVRKLYEEAKEDVRIPVRFVAGMNELFRVRDTSGAVEQRLLILPTRHTVRGTRDQIIDLYELHIAPEAPGILNRAIEGLRRLLTRGRFEPPQAHSRATAIFSEESNHLISWMKDRTHEGQRYQDPDSVVPEFRSATLSTDLYADYAEWAKANGYRGLSASTWGGRLGRMGFQVDVLKIGGKACRVRNIHLISIDGKGY